MSFTYLSKVENGRVPYTPSPEKIRLLAEALGVDALELLQAADKVPPEVAGLADNPAARIAPNRRPNRSWGRLP